MIRTLAGCVPALGLGLVAPSTAAASNVSMAGQARSRPVLHRVVWDQSLRNRGGVHL